MGRSRIRFPRTRKFAHCGHEPEIDYAAWFLGRIRITIKSKIRRSGWDVGGPKGACEASPVWGHTA